VREWRRFWRKRRAVTNAGIATVDQFDLTMP
jgi:hypothetical protein